MAAESTATASIRAPGGRTTPVLVPQGALVGRPDIPLDRAVTTVGSSETSRLHLVSRTISKSHALLVNSGGGTYVADLASRTGVLVNGKAVSDSELKTGDRVQIGKFQFRYRSPTNAASPTPVGDPPPAAVIVVGSPPVAITGRVTRIGRRETSEVCLSNDAAVSAAHAVIFQVDGRWAIRDLGSRTGTVVNDKAVHQQALKFGDRIEIGSSTILFQPAKAAPIPARDGEPTELPAEERTEAVAETPEPDSIPEATAAAELVQEVGVAAMEPLAVEEIALPHGDQPAQTAATADPDFIPLADETAAPVPAVELEPISEPVESVLELPLVDEIAPASPTDEATNVDDVPSTTAHGDLDDIAEHFALDESQPVEADTAAIESVEAATVPEEATAAFAFASPTQEPLVAQDASDLVEHADQENIAQPAAHHEPLPVEANIAAPEPVESTTPSHEAAVTLALASPTEDATSDDDITGSIVLAEEHTPIDRPLPLDSDIAAADPVESSAVSDEMMATSAPDAELRFDHASSAAPEALVEETVSSNDTDERLSFDEVKPIEPVGSGLDFTAEPLATESNVVPAPLPSDRDETLESEVPIGSGEFAESSALDETAHGEPGGVAPELSTLPIATEEPIAATAIEPAPDRYPRESLSFPAAEETPVDDLPEVIFWGDPELDAVAEQAILAGPETHAPQVNNPVASGAASPGSSDLALEKLDGGSPVEPVHHDLEEPAIELPDNPANAPAEVVAAEPLDSFTTPKESASTDKEDFLTSEPLAPMPVFAESIDEVALEESPISADPIADVDVEVGHVHASMDDDAAAAALEPASEPVHVETVLGNESAATAEDSLPDGAVTVTNDLTAGEGHAVVNEFMAGDSAPAVEATDEPVAEIVDKSAISALPATEDFLAADDAVASVEGLEPLPGDEASVSDEFTSDTHGVEWLDDASSVESTLASSPGEQQSGSESVAETIAPMVEAVKPVQGLVETSAASEEDLEFLELGEPEADASTGGSGSPQKAGDAAGGSVVDATAPRRGPSLFGFEFEGGSFLGGMPLKLTPELSAETLPTMAGPPSVVFDAKSQSPSGLGAMVVPPPPARSIKPPATRPMTPPRPVRNTIAPNSNPRSLTGLGTDSPSPWPAPPVIPPTARETARSANGPRGSRPMMAASAPGTKPRNLDVFSQLSAPIGVEVFGGRPGNPANYQVPDSTETRAKAGEGNPDENGSPVAAMPARVAAPRRSRIPLLVMMLILFPAALFGAIFSFVPSSARIIGTMKFEGVSGQNSRVFWVAQKNRLGSDGIRGTAREMLSLHHDSPGFTDDPIAFSKVMDNPSAVTWGTDWLQFEYASFDPSAGRKQVSAVLEALRSADRDLDDIKARAQYEKELATQARVVAHDAVESIDRQRKLQLQLTLDTPDKTTLDQLDNTAAHLTQEWSDARTIRQSSASVLADLRARDPGKAVDVNSDPQMLDLRKQLDQLNDQIARSKSPGALSTPTGSASTVTAGNPIPATTEPTGGDPLLAVLQQQADKLRLKLEHRRAELKADAALSPEQRAVNLQAAIENMSIKLVTLDRVEADAKGASEQATAAADAAHKRFDNARIAGAKADDLAQQQMTVEESQKQAIDAENEKQAVLDSCITVAHGATAPISIAATDLFEPQWPAWAVSTVLIEALLAWMIYTELTRRAVIPGATPAAAPLVNPPLRAIPWPQPQQLEGLNARDTHRLEPQEPEHASGV